MEDLGSLEDRMRKLENEQTRMRALLEFGQDKVADQLTQYRDVMKRNTDLLMGDGDTKEGLIAWKNRMDSRYKTVMKLFAAVGAILLEVIRERVLTFLK